MKEAKQLNLSKADFLPKVTKPPHKEVFLLKMERIIPWPRLEALIEPHCFQQRNQREPFGHTLATDAAKPISCSNSSATAT
jgi:hypothetical protein